MQFSDDDTLLQLYKSSKTMREQINTEIGEYAGVTFPDYYQDMHTCTIDGCSQKEIGYGFCAEHSCSVDGCDLPPMLGSVYCEEHGAECEDCGRFSLHEQMEEADACSDSMGTGHRCCSKRVCPGYECRQVPCGICETITSVPSMFYSDEDHRDQDFLVCMTCIEANDLGHIYNTPREKWYGISWEEYHRRYW